METNQATSAVSVVSSPDAVPVGAASNEFSPPEIRIYSHSAILYWWPVWLVGFAMAILTYMDGGQMAYVPAGTVADGNTLVVPEGTVVLGSPHDRMAANPYLGSWFFVVFLVVFTASNISLRGVWEWVAILAIALAITLISLWSLWDDLTDWFRLLHVHINLAGYLFLSTWIFAIWLVTVFLFDRKTYITFSAGQVRVLNEIGGAEKVSTSRT